MEELCINSDNISLLENKNISDVRYQTYLNLKEKYPTLPNLDYTMINNLLTIYENKDENLNFIKTIIDDVFLKKLSN